MKLYVASSWRNLVQPQFVASLRAEGFDVYDFRNPEPGERGFSWRECGKGDPKSWNVDDYREVLSGPIAQAGFKFDMDALRACDAVVLVLPCGRSAHLEAGWAAGAGKRVVVYMPVVDEAELMYLMNGPAGRVCPTFERVIKELVAP